MKSGVIYRKKEDTIIEHTMFGYLEYPNKIANNLQTSFPTASAGKVFVAVGILKLIEEQHIQLNTPLFKILSIDLGAIDTTTTIKELLTHTSNIPNYFDEEEVNDYSDLWKNIPNYSIRKSTDLLPLFIHKKRDPSTKGTFVYNDSGFVLLGLIIETITNMPFDQYLQEIIFKPLSMNHTGYYELDRLPPNTATAYILNQNGNYYSYIYSIDAKGSGAGGAFTNAEDIDKFWTGLLSNTLLKKETTDNMLYPHVIKEKFRYGLGIWLDNNNNPYIVGDDPGVKFISYYHKKTMYHHTIISNMNDNVFSIHHDLKLQYLKK